MSSPSQKYKIIVIGDGMVGKTCLLITYVHKKFPSEYVPTVFENYSGSVKVNQNEEINFELWDTAGQEQYGHLRPLTYPNTDAIILCFSVVQPSSFENIEAKWMKEIKESSDLKNKPIILVGTKTDSRQLTMQLKVDPISFDQGKRLANRIGAEAYIECSARTKTGVKDVFDQALYHAHKRHMKRCKKHGCNLM